MKPIVPLTREVVLIGGGHAHALVMRRWGMEPIPGMRLTVINPLPTAPYTGMLPGFVAGHYDRDTLEIDLVPLARFAGARLIPAYAEGIDRANRRIRVTGGREIAYDIASIDVGITTDMPQLPGFAEHGVAAKPLQRFADAWTAYREDNGPAEIAILGGGVGGVELSMAMAHALRSDGRDATITVVEAALAVPDLRPRARRAVLKGLDANGVTLIEGARAERVEADRIVLTDGREIRSTLTVGAAGARPWPWLSELGLDHQDGYLCVNRYLQTSDPAIYGAGDCVHVRHSPHRKAGVYAVRSAPILARNIRGDLTGSSRIAFNPQGDFLKLISLGGKDAIGEKWGITVQGPRVWRLKNRIDRDFMRSLERLPDMTEPLSEKPARGVGKLRPLCGGCGSKVGLRALAPALETFGPTGRADVERLPGDDGAVLTMGGVRQVITTDHLRAFTDDPHLMARIAAQHALGDIWAMGAAPQAALASIILPHMNEDMQTVWLDEIMSAARAVFEEAGAEIAGGHTTMGRELTIGFTVTGLLDGAAITRAGAKAGDALLLTRPLGSGTILAADMAMKAPGPVVLDLLDALTRPQAEAARRLARAHAMTDVTGFGLAGHLLGICEASGLAAELSLGAVPLFNGALALSEAGHRSTIYPTNRLACEARMSLPATDPRLPLLFDPQTAGGLLAALPEAEAHRIAEALTGSDEPAAVIGHLTEGTPGITVTG